MHKRSFLTGIIGLLAVPQVLCAEDAPIKVRDLYVRGGGFSDLAISLEGERVTLEGFMAPPLKADSQFFVLTKMPMAVCPFCESEAEWPDDIIAVYTKRTVRVKPFNVKIEIRGVLDLKGFKDPETGFFSKLRLVDATHG